MSQLKPPPQGITVRMYRQGHGDCFLLSACKENGGSFYMVIDCGLWTGSECGPECDKVTMREVVADIAESTAGKLDVLVITHEHMDHVSGFTAPKGATEGKFYWDAIEIDEVWLAWTEDPKDPDANALRKRFDDILLGLAAVGDQPSRFGIDEGSYQAHLIRDVLALHTGETDLGRLAHGAPSPLTGLAAAGGDRLAAITGLSNKVAMKRMRDKARRVRFFSPGESPHQLSGVSGGVRVYALGPPRDPSLLLSLNPKGPEEFKFRLDGPAAALLGALASVGDDTWAGNPFSPRYGMPPELLTGHDAVFFATHYGELNNPMHSQSWRAIESDWLDAAEDLALRLNSEVNNTSLVLAFELPRTGKVLLFTGDAQRGSWVSWGKLEWEKGSGRVTARDLLARTVLYKVGHHGSHNATLNGRTSDEFANLEWLGRGDYAQDFVAFIPANKEWAENKTPKPWKHPLKAIEEALLDKAGGRVFRMDASRHPTRPPDITAGRWDNFIKQSEISRLYAQYTVLD
jgi:hypothetical protein